MRIQAERNKFNAMWHITAFAGSAIITVIGGCRQTALRFALEKTATMYSTAPKKQFFYYDL